MKNKIRERFLDFVIRVIIEMFCVSKKFNKQYGRNIGVTALLYRNSVTIIFILFLPRIFMLVLLFLMLADLFFVISSKQTLKYSLTKMNLSLK